MTAPGALKPAPITPLEKLSGTEMSCCCRGPIRNSWSTAAGVITKAVGVTAGGLGEGQTVTATTVSVDPIINDNSLASGTITNTTGAGTSPIVISTSDTTGLTNGRVVTIIGASEPNANGTFVIDNVTNTSFELVGTTGDGTAGSGGTWINSFASDTITSSTGADTSPIVVSTPSTAGLIDGRVVTIIGASDPNANGTFVIGNVITDTSFQLVGTTGAGTAGAGGTWITGGAVTFTADTVKGTGGKISAATAYRSVNIKNFSDRHLVINGINVVTPSTTPTIFIDATDWQTFTFTAGNDVSPTDITIANEGANSDVQLVPINAMVPGTTVQGFSIYNPLGTTKIIAADGSILNAAGAPSVPSVWTRDLDLQAAGSVGDGDSNGRLNVRLVKDSGQTDLDVQAGGDVFLDLEGRFRATGNTVFEGGTIQTSGQSSQIDLLLESAVQDVAVSAPSGTISVQRYVNNVLMAFDSDALALPTYTTSSVAGTYQFKQLIAGAVSGNITINAADPLAPDPLVSFASGTDMGNTSGELVAVTNGDLTLSERSGDFRIRTVSSSAGNVSLAATGDDGSIVDVDDSEAPPFGATAWVTGNSVSLSSRDGGIGSPGDFLEINSSNQAPGAVIALAKNDVYLTETAGDLNIDKVLSRISDVVLIAQQGAILEAGADTQADIQGRNIDLIATTAVSFNPSSVQNDQISFATDHNLTDEQQVIYQPGNGNDPISGLTEGQHVWAIYIDATTIQLASSLDNAQNETFITLDPTGSTGLQHSLTLATTVASFDPSSVQNDQISFATDHNLTDGEQVIYRTGNGNDPISPLTEGQHVWVIYIDATTIKPN